MASDSELEELRNKLSQAEKALEDCRNKKDDKDDNKCGNDVCDSGESASSCPEDCSSDPVCGDGNDDEGEQCDDGNTFDNDGCSSTCQNES